MSDDAAVPAGPPFTVATWNVNSLRMRMPRLLAWLKDQAPDVLCLQELKMEEGIFPTLDLLGAGYRAVAVGQKTYNGVAVLWKQEHGAAVDVLAHIQDDDPDQEARIIAATLPGLGVRVASVYVPNGQSVGSDKYVYKLRWLRRLRQYLDRRCDPAQQLILAGDFNIAPDDRDVYDPVGWRDTVICHEEARKALADVMAFGLQDALRLCTQEPKIYTYWDYRMLAFPKNLGLRIDHVLVTAPLAARCAEAQVDRQARKGQQPSDHAPLVVRFR